MNVGTYTTVPFTPVFQVRLKYNRVKVGRDALVRLVDAMLRLRRFVCWTCRGPRPPSYLLLFLPGNVVIYSRGFLDLIR